MIYVKLNPYTNYTIYIIFLYKLCIITILLYYKIIIILYKNTIKYSSLILSISASFNILIIKILLI